MNHSRSSETPRRVIRWRYRTAVQAARMLNRVAACPHERTSHATRPALARPSDALEC